MLNETYGSHASTGRAGHGNQEDRLTNSGHGQPEGGMSKSMDGARSPVRNTSSSSSGAAVRGDEGRDGGGDRGGRLPVGVNYHMKCNYFIVKRYEKGQALKPENFLASVHGYERARALAIARRRELDRIYMRTQDLPRGVEYDEQLHVIVSTATDAKGSVQERTFSLDELGILRAVTRAKEFQGIASLMGGDDEDPSTIMYMR
jgi:hypothetical protein